MDEPVADDDRHTAYRIGVEAATLLRAVIAGEAPVVTRIDLGFILMVRDSA